MSTRLRALAAATAVALVLTTPSIVSAAITVPYSVRGIEVHATSTEGTFTGVTWAADDYGTWQAVVQHTVFDANDNATITGGTFTLDGNKRDVNGTFTSGTVTFLWADSGCGRQVFDVDGAMDLAGGGTGSFDATLTHYRTSVFGHCITYWATVRGTTTLSLP
jgi:hypothetical protein